MWILVCYRVGIFYTWGSVFGFTMGLMKTTWFTEATLRTSILEHSIKWCTVLAPFLPECGDPGEDAVSVAQRACAWGGLCPPHPASPSKWARQPGITLQLAPATARLPVPVRPDRPDIGSSVGPTRPVGPTPGADHTGYQGLPSHWAALLSEVTWAGG